MNAVNHLSMLLNAEGRAVQVDFVSLKKAALILLTFRLGRRPVHPFPLSLAVGALHQQLRSYGVNFQHFQVGMQRILPACHASQ